MRSPRRSARDCPTCGELTAQEHAWQWQADQPACAVPDDMFPPLHTFGVLAPKLARLGHAPIPITRRTDLGAWITAPGKQPALKGWQQGCPEYQWPRFSRHGVGILASSTPGLDIDIVEPDLAEAVATHARAILGHGPERIGRPPKRLLPYRLEGEPFRKLRMEWDGGNGVEILADGQSYVVAGIHPGTRRPYSWTGLSCELWNIPRDRLAPLSHRTGVLFMRALAKWLGRRGVKVHHRQGFALEPPRPKPPPERRRPVDAGDEANAKFERALECGLAAVRGQAEGGRNSTLWREAFSLSRLIDEGRITSHALESELLAATALPEREAIPTIASGFRARRQAV